MADYIDFIANYSCVEVSVAKLFNSLAQAQLIVDKLEEQIRHQKNLLDQAQLGLDKIKEKTNFELKSQLFHVDRILRGTSTS